jgi:hypothetical protein
MTDPDYTAIGILVDRSGSMQSVRKDAEGAINAFIADQRASGIGKCTIRISQFDYLYETVYESTDVAEAQDYRLEPRGNTALYDAIGKLATEFGQELAAIPEPQRPAKVLMVVQTDGYENASMEWTAEAVGALIKTQQDLYGWRFVFLGATEEAIVAARTMGFDPGSTMAYSGSGIGTVNAVHSTTQYARAMRAGPGGQSVSFTDEDRAAAQK